jgi:hypothetical protein
MSMMYCHTHDRLWDSDYYMTCPGCENADPPYLFCWYCSQGSRWEDIRGDWCPQCGEDYPEHDYLDYVENWY